MNSNPLIVFFECSVLGKGRLYNTARTGIYHYIRNLGWAMASRLDLIIIPICLDPACAIATLDECKTLGLDKSFLEQQISQGYRLFFMLENLLAKFLLFAAIEPGSTSKVSRFLFYLKNGFKNQYLTRFTRNTSKSIRDLDYSPKTIVIHETYRTHRGPVSEMLYQHAVARCITIYDMIPLLFPDLFATGISEEFKSFISSLGRNDTVVAISGTTKRDFCLLSNIDESDVFVTPLAVDSRFMLLDESEYNPAARKLMAKHGLSDSKFILSIATLEPRKNISSLISAFAATADTIDPGIKLVLTGEPGWEKVDLRKLVNSHGLTSRVVFTGYLEDEILPVLLNEASIFCYLSLYEGFGMPVLEAMSCGCPVITSNNSSLGEFFGGIASCVDPTNISEISINMHKILGDKMYAYKLRDAGLNYASKFNAANLAEHTIKAYQHAANVHGIVSK